MVFLRIPRSSSPRWKVPQTAVFGVLDDPGHARPRGCVHAPDAVRDELYRLYMPNAQLSIVDLAHHRGNACGYTARHRRDLGRAMNEITLRSLVAVRGHTYSQYLAYEKLGAHSQPGVHRCPFRSGRTRTRAGG